MVNLHTTKKDFIFLIILLLFLLTMGLIGLPIVSIHYHISFLILITIIITFVILVVYRQLSAELKEWQNQNESRRFQDYRQLEALLSLILTLKPVFPLPDTRGWAASPDFLKKITEIISTEKPSLVVEASSGVSSVIIAYTLKKLGKGKVLSLEHDVKYAEKTQEMIIFHGLESIAKVIYAPLREYELKGKKWLWYNIDDLEFIEPIDLFVIDGPGFDVQELSRFPAVPLLYHHLNQPSTIILDDGKRSDEKEIVRLWEKEYHTITSEFIENEKGAYLIRLNNQ